MDKDTPCACCRENTWEEVLRKNIKNEHELEIVLEHIARAETMLEMQRRVNKKLTRENTALSKEIAFLVNQLINGEELEDDHEFSRYFSFTMNRLKSNVKGQLSGLQPPTEKEEK